MTLVQPVTQKPSAPLVQPVVTQAPHVQARVLMVLASSQIILQKLKNIALIIAIN